MTESGKTTLAKTLAARYEAAGVRCAVLDPLADPGWQVSYQTGDQGEFLRTVKRSRSLAVYVDEAGEAVGQYDTEMHWLATRGRHYGHACHFISQRVQQIAKTVRDQTARMYMFASSRSDSKLLSDEWNEPAIAESHRLARGEFWVVQRFGELRRGQVDFATGSVTLKTRG